MHLVERTKELDSTNFLNIYRFIVDLYHYIQAVSKDNGADAVAPVIADNIASMSSDEQQKLHNLFEPLTWFGGPLAYAATTLLSPIANTALIKSTRRNMSYRDAIAIDDKTPLLLEKPKEIKKKLIPTISLQVLPKHTQKKNEVISKTNEQLDNLLDFVEELRVSTDMQEQSCWAAVCCLALVLQNTIKNINTYQTVLTMQDFVNDIENYKFICRDYLATQILSKQEPSFFAKFFCCCQSSQAPAVLARLDAITQQITFTHENLAPTVN